MQLTNLNHSTNNFDFIRFLAASFVIVTHSYALKGINDGEDSLGKLTFGLYPFSFFGVRIFFLISGYLILQSFERKKSYFDYLWKRILRIFPGLIILIVVMVSIYGPFLSIYSIKSYFSNPETYQMFWCLSLYRLTGDLPEVFYLDNKTQLIGSLWTLCYEFSMYLGLMVLGIFNLIHKKHLNLFIWILGVTICVFYPSYFNSILNGKYIPFLRLDAWYTIEFSTFFLGGMLIHQFKTGINFKLSIFILIILSFVISVVLENQILVRVLIYGLLPYIVFYLGNLKSIFNNFGKYGDFSYGIYIYGYPVQQMLIFLTKNEISVLNLQVLSFIIVIPIAFLSWHLVEKQALKFKNTLFRPKITHFHQSKTE